jgi:UDP-glucuronate 4-epimerase
MGMMGRSLIVVVTGCAGFIGFHLARRLLNDGHLVVGVDNLNEYYDVKLKLDRLRQLENNENFKFHRVSLENYDELCAAFHYGVVDAVVNLAAQAGVRYSLENPRAYIDSNITGFLNVLEACRHFRVKHLLYASSSSVYGGNTKVPFSEHDAVDHPISLYAATKKSNELMAHAYSNLYDIPTTGLRFFTVYGPWGRPDMALFLFTRAILSGEPIKVFNNGNMWRDFTYIDDAVEAVVRLLDHVPSRNADWYQNPPDPSSSFAPYRVYNIGNSRPVKLARFIEVLEDVIGIKARKEFLPLQPGDVLSTFADVTDLVRDTGFQPTTPIETGIRNFVDWYRSYYEVGNR